MTRPDAVSFMRVLGVIGIIFLILPVATIIPLSFTPDRYLHLPAGEWSLRWYRNLLTSPAWYESLGTSLAIASGVAVLAPTLGMLAAYGLYRTRDRFRDSMILIFLLPIFLPPVVLGVGMILVFSNVSLVD